MLKAFIAFICFLLLFLYATYNTGNTSSVTTLSGIDSNKLELHVVSVVLEKGREMEDFVIHCIHADQALCLKFWPFHMFINLSGQIDDATSLFTYPEGLSALNFSFPDHSPRFLSEVLENATSDTRALCGNNVECIFDTIETGSMAIGLETLQTNQNNNNDQMVACKFQNPSNKT